MALLMFMNSTDFIILIYATAILAECQEKDNTLADSSRKCM